jgi:purine-nucleoside phosphorylase
MTGPPPSFASSIAAVRARTPFAPDAALVLGSGLGDFADSLEQRTVIPTSDIPGYPLSTVEGHKGRLVFGRLGEKKLLAFQGRIHFYESNDFLRVLHPIAIASALGVRVLIVTNAAGGVNRHFTPGDLMIITDQLDLTMAALPDNAPESPRVPLYDMELASLAERLAAARGIRVWKGVYAGVKGPSYETAAEVEMVYRLGGDAVGMSTVKEVQFAARAGMKILGISCITNKATGIGREKLAHSEVTEVANRVKRDFTLLLTDCILGL